MSGGSGIVSEGRVSNLHFIITNDRKNYVLGFNKKMTIPLKFTALGRSYFAWRYCCPHTVAEIAGGVSLVGLTTISAAATPRVRTLLDRLDRLPDVFTAIRRKAIPGWAYNLFRTLELCGI